MHKLVAIFLVAVLACSITVPNAFSDDDEKNNNSANNQENDDGENNHQENDANSHTNDHDETKENDKIHFGFSNATSVNFTLPNGTKVTFAFSNGTNIGHRISSFIHDIRSAFIQEANQSKQVIKDCRLQAKNASSDKKTIMEQCKDKLQEIKNQFHSEQKQFQVDLKQLRELVSENKENHEKPHPPQDHDQNQTQFLGKQKGPEQVLKHQGPRQWHGKQDWYRQNYNS